MNSDNRPIHGLQEKQEQEKFSKQYISIMKNNEQHKQETLYLYEWLNEQYNKNVSIRKKPLKKRLESLL